jgi:hypothetical protein
MVRPVAIGRRNWTFLGAERGGHAAAVWYSIVAAAKANRVEPWAWCRDLIQRLAELGDAPSTTNQRRRTFRTQRMSSSFVKALH